MGLYNKITVNQPTWIPKRLLSRLKLLRISVPSKRSSRSCSRSCGLNTLLNSSSSVTSKHAVLYGLFTLLTVGRLQMILNRVGKDLFVSLGILGHGYCTIKDWFIWEDILGLRQYFANVMQKWHKTFQAYKKLCVILKVLVWVLAVEIVALSKIFYHN